MKTQNYTRLEHIISKFPECRVLVVGDLMLDEFVWGAVERISPEAPVPVVRVNSESFMPGGASNVANNIASLGGKAGVCGVAGKDERARILKNELRRGGIDTDGIIEDPARPTILKTRIIAGHQQVVRVDREKTDGISSAVFRKLIAFLEKAIPEADAVLIEDYGKGLVSPDLIRAVKKTALRLHKIVGVDPKEEHFSYYKGVTFLTPNKKEAASAAGINIKDDRSLYEAGGRILNKLACSTLLITLGEQGMCIFEKGKRPHKIATVAREVYDVSGAGDTVIAAYCLAAACGASTIQAVHIANCAAGIVVGKLGTAVVTPAELKDRIGQEIGKWKQ